MAIVATSNREVALLNVELSNATRSLKRSVACNKTMLRYLDYLIDIKAAIEKEDLMFAQQLWEDLSYKDQESLMIAPTKGGAFTTKERAIVQSFWKVTVADLESR